MEAVHRTHGGRTEFLLGELCERIPQLKLSRTQRLSHLLFLEFFRLKCVIAKHAGSHSQMLKMYTDLDVDPFTSLYAQLSTMELKSHAKRKSANTMAFVQQELFPIAIREVPFVFIQKISQCSFDSDLFPEDAGKLWLHPLNQGLVDWRKLHPIHRWSDSIMKAQAVGRLNSTHPALDTQAQSEAVTVAYEAPWVMPTIGKDGVKNPRRSVAAPTARMVKMEGRRQSYKPSPTDRLAANSDAICLVNGSEEDGFAISRGVLDAMRDWTHDDSQGGALMVANHGASGIGDVLEDLLHSPTQPGTRVQSPVKSAKKRPKAQTPQTAKRMRTSPKRDISPTPFVSDENAPPVNPASVSRNEPAKAMSPLSQLLLDSEVSTAVSSEIKDTGLLRKRPVLKRPPEERQSTSPATMLKAAKPTVREDVHSDRASRKSLRDENDYSKFNIL